MNYDFLMFWLWNCKDFMIIMLINFIMKEEKLQ